MASSKNFYIFLTHLKANKFNTPFTFFSSILISFDLICYDSKILELVNKKNIVSGNIRELDRVLSIMYLSLYTNY